MSKADELLTAAFEDGEQAYPTDTEIEPHIIIGADRSVTVPDELKKIAVQHDHDIETVTFDCPRYWDGRDMSAMVVYINYRLPDGKIGAYIADNVRLDDADPSIMHFDWTISGYVTQTPGFISFLVCVKRVYPDTAILQNHWNSDLCSQMYISEGMECPPEVILPQVDIITQLLTLIPEMREAVTHVSNAETAAIAASEAADRANAAAAGAESYAEYSDYMANALTASVSGETIRVDDVSPLAHKVKVRARGKNLIPPFTENYSIDRSGTVYSGEADGQTITLNGVGNVTAGGRNSLSHVAGRFKVEKGKTYTLSQELVSGSCDGIYVVYINLDNAERTPVANRSSEHRSKTFISEYTGDCFVGINISAGTNYDNAVIRFQLEEGDTATEYEPYIDPTTVTVTRCGKNLLDVRTSYTETVSGVTFTFDENGKCTLNGTNTSSDWIYVYAKLTDSPFGIKKGTTVTVSGINCPDSTYSIRIFTDKTVGDTVGGLQGDYYAPKTVTLADDTVLKIVLIRVGPNATVKNAVVMPLVEIGSAATKYEKYTRTAHVPNADGTVNGIRSVSPTMTLLTDTPGVTIEAEYNVDTAAFVDEIYSRIPTVVQETGEDESAVMSQKAVTEMHRAVFENRVISTNLLNPAKITKGCYVALRGTAVEHENYRHSDFIAVSEGDTISMSTTENGTSRYAVNFIVTAYDCDKNALFDCGVGTSTSSYTVPEGVCFVIVSYVHTENSPQYDHSIVKGTAVLPFDEYCEREFLKEDAISQEIIEKGLGNYKIPLENCEFAEKPNLYDISTIVSGYVYNGRISANASYVTTDYIKVKPNTQYSFYTSSASKAWWLCEYDENYGFIKNGRDVTTLTTGETTEYIRASFLTSAKNVTIVKGSAADPNASNEWGIPEELIIKAADSSEVVAFIPDEIVCAVGRTIEIYNSQVCPCADKYHFRWNCQIGKALKRKYSVTATEALIGNYSLVLEIYNDDLKIVYTKTATLKIVANTISAAKSICPIGDSLTNGKYWLTEVRTLSENQISYVGTRGITAGLKHEGRSGFTSASYLAATSYSFEGEGVHPFWDSANSKFSWSYYKTNSNISPNAVQIFLGTNDLAGNITAEQFAANVKTMVDDIRSTDATIPIFIVLTLCWGNQNGIGNQTSSDGFASQKGRFKYDEDVTTITGVKTLYDTLKNYSNLYFIPLTQCHDSEYNFGGVETPVNPRATQTELIPGEGVHPQKQGYEQFADVMYSVYCEAFS